MAKAEASVEELVGMIQRGELRLPEMQRQYVWRSTRVRDLLDSLYRGYPSGAILLWETDEDVPLQDMAVAQQHNPYQSTRLLLDGQQRLTSLSAVIRGEPVQVRGRRRPIELLFNLEHPDQLTTVTEVDENADDEVTEIFVRVNSLGAKLRSSDLALAQITAKWRHSLEIFQKFQEDCAKTGFDLELGLYLKNLIAFATGQSRFKTVSTLPLERLQSSWKQSCQGMDFAMNFLRSNAGIESLALMSSPFLLVAVAYYCHSRDYALSVDESTQLRYWALAANAKGRYSRGSSETILDQDLATIRQGGTVQDLIDRLRQQVGRLDITPDELEGRNQRSALFKTMFLAFRLAGAKDWRSNLAIALDHSGVQHRLQFHHIFPKAQLKDKFTSREADDIANLAFIGGKTNRAISDKPPATYLPPLVAQLGQPTFAAQAIPVDLALLEVSAYKDFVAERRKRIAAALNAFLGS